MGLINFRNLANTTGPTYVQRIEDIYLLWFEVSNKYVLVDNANYNHIILYLDSTNRDSFCTQLKEVYPETEIDPTTIYEDIKSFLNSCQEKPKSKKGITIRIKTKLKVITEAYEIYGQLIVINYCSEKTKSLIHPLFAHLTSTIELRKSSTSFSIELIKDNLFLFKNGELRGQFHKNSYHLLQGQFAIELLSALTHTSEMDWLATFHGSTIAKNDQGIMLIGESGRGKSTLAALLTLNGFDLVADDFSPMLTRNNSICAYPAAISIKQGAFQVLKPYYKDFKNLPSYNLRKSKGTIKYIAPSSNPSYRSYICQFIILVNYKKDAQTHLKKTSPEKLLQILIPDSWISPQKNHALQFLHWLNTVQYYEITYSNFKEAKVMLTKLFRPPN